MYKLSTAISMLALAVSSVAMPTIPVATLPPTRGLAIGASIKEGVSAPTPTVAPQVQARNIRKPPEYLTVVIINSHGDAISTSLDTNPSAPKPVSGATTPGTMRNGETASIVLPTNWIGNWAINDAHFELSDNDSLIEANFAIGYETSYAEPSVDVSYVDGFSVAIVCSCDGVVVSGCNKNLFELHTCPDEVENACINPLRSSLSATEAAPFFAPCAGKAYTFPNDSKADSTGQCQNGVIKCCVGAACSD